jgi:hypothetical protein
MPTTIGNSNYSMQKIEKIVARKRVIVDRALEIVRKLDKDFLNERKMEQHQMMDAQTMTKFKFKGDWRHLQKNSRDGLVFLGREMGELNEEFGLVQELHELVMELNKLSTVENVYFREKK